MKYSINSNEILHNLFEDFDQGDIDGIDALAYAKQLYDLAEAIKSHEDFKDSALSEIDKYAKGEHVTRSGFYVSQQNRTTYTYDFDYYKSLKKKHKDQIKTLEDTAKSAMKSPNGVMMMPDENGEIIEIPAAIPKYNTIVVFSTKPR